MAVTKAEVLQRMQTIGLLPVLRAESLDEGLALAKAIVAGGIRALEITMTVPGALQLIGLLSREQPGIIIGAGTVMDPETARLCILEGAQFVVSPALNVKTVELCQRYTVPVFPGALTPTEVVTAWSTGADVIKIFPASAMGGASYLKSLKGPLPQIEMIPTGGVSVSTARDFFEAGAFALGVGSELADRRAIATGHSDRVAMKAAQYVQIVREFRQAQQDRKHAEISAE
jgi:2-dehydro-3-deoxyphosphogluconate aldolase/(4S)-4-hydroxy-2-oxoglutarate aldolase